MKSINRNSKS